MKPVWYSLLVMAGALAGGGAVHAQTSELVEWRQLSPAERAEIRQQMREEWQRLSQEEREARKKEYREYRQAHSPGEPRRERSGPGHARKDWEHLRPEDREQLKDMLYERHSRRRSCQQNSTIPGVVD